MKLAEQTTQFVSVRAAIIVIGAIACLALSSTSGRRVVGLGVVAATVIGSTSATLAAAETSDAGIRPFRANVPEADVAELKRRLAATRWSGSL